MARVTTPLLRKIKRVLTERFPSPATVRLEDHDGVIGVITSESFRRMESLDRQKLIDDILATHLSRDERRQVQIIVGVTPDEETGYLAGAE